MPHIAITMIPGRDKEQKQKLARTIQNIVKEELKIPEKFISVSIEDIPLEHWEQSMEQFSEEIMYIKPE